MTTAIYGDGREVIEAMAWFGGAFVAVLIVGIPVALAVASARSRRADREERHRLLKSITGENPIVTKGAHRA